MEALVADISPKNIEGLVEGADCILDATDNFETRFLINDAAIKHRIPWVYGAAVGSYGVSMTVLPQETPCLRCVLEELPAPGSSPTCDTAGVLSPIVNVVASVQVAEAAQDPVREIFGGLTVVCFVLTFGRIHTGRLRSRTSGNKEIVLAASCAASSFWRKREAPLATTLCGRDSVQISVREGGGLNLKELAQRLKAVGQSADQRVPAALHRRPI